MRNSSGGYVLAHTVFLFVMACAAIPSAVLAGERVYVFNGWDAYGQAVRSVGAKDDRKDSFSIHRYSEKDGRQTLYSSEADFPECQVYYSQEPAVLISDSNGEHARFLVVTDIRGKEEARISLITKSDTRTHTFGWLGSGERFFYSEELDYPDKENCRASQGIYMYDLAKKERVLVSSTARGAVWIESLRKFVISSGCFDCGNTHLTFDMVSGTVAPIILMGTNISLEGRFYTLSCDDEGTSPRVIYDVENREVPETQSILRTMYVCQWLPNSTALLRVGMKMHDVPESAKHDYLYSVGANRLRRLPGCYVAKCADPKYILIAAAPDGKLAEFCLDNAEPIEPKDLPYYNTLKDNETPSAAK